MRATNLFAPAMQLVPDPPFVTAHDTNWFKDDTAVKIPFNDHECRYAVYRVALILARGSSLVVTHCTADVRVMSDRLGNP